MDQIDRILSKEFSWKTYWNRPFTLFFLMSGSIMLFLFYYFFVSGSETLWGFFLLVGVGFFACGILLLDYYFLGGILLVILSFGTVIGIRMSSGETTILAPRVYYTKIQMSLPLMKRMRPYLIDRYTRPEVNKEDPRWIKLYFKNENRYKYDKLRSVLWIYRKNRTKEMLDVEYYGIFNELKTWKRKVEKK